MSNAFGGVTNSQNLEKQEADVIGGNYTLLESGIYPATITKAYITESKNGALGVNLEYSVVIDEANNTIQKINMTEWVTNRNKETFYKKDGKEYGLPSYNKMQDVLGVIAKTTLEETDTPTGNVAVRNFETGKDEIKQYPIVKDLLDKKIAVCVLKCRTNKQKLDGNKYVPIAEERNFNEVDKVLTADCLTKTERDNGLTEPEYATKWKEKWEGNTKDTYKEVASETNSGSGATTQTLDIG